MHTRTRAHQLGNVLHSDLPSTSCKRLRHLFCRAPIGGEERGWLPQSRDPAIHTSAYQCLVLRLSDCLCKIGVLLSPSLHTTSPIPPCNMLPCAVQVTTAQEPEPTGYFDLVIKRYPEGKMSKHIADLDVRSHSALPLVASFPPHMRGSVPKHADGYGMHISCTGWAGSRCEGAHQEVRGRAPVLDFKCNIRSSGFGSQPCKRASVPSNGPLA